MNKKELLEKFKKGEIAVKFKNKKEANMVLEYLDDKDIIWYYGENPSEFMPDINKFLIVWKGRLIMDYEENFNKIISATEFLGASEDIGLSTVSPNIKVGDTWIVNTSEEKKKRLEEDIETLNKALKIKSLSDSSLADITGLKESLNIELEELEELI